MDEQIINVQYVKSWIWIVAGNSPPPPPEVCLLCSISRLFTEVLSTQNLQLSYLYHWSSGWKDGVQTSYYGMLIVSAVISLLA